MFRKLVLNVFVHGFAVDDKGRKMSKSVGNVVDPVDIVQGGKNPQKQPALGIDTLRWWVSSHATQHATVPVSQSTLQDSKDAVHKLRLVLKFLLGALHDYPPLTTRKPESGDSFTPLEQYMLHLLWSLNQQSTQLGDNWPDPVPSLLISLLSAPDLVSAEVVGMYENYQYNTVCATLVNFVTNQVSAFYCHIIKDRLYCEHESNPRRRDCQTVLFYILETLTGAFAPVVPHLAEEIYLYHPHYTGSRSVYRGGVVAPSPHWNRPHLLQQMNTVLELRRQVNKAAPTPNTWELDAVVFSQGDVFTTLQVLPTISINLAMVH
uniref:Uncharacterized protein n=1 Tax=Timema bartmani TaxID=61472 RepID=A0A7R9F666_9NEOP|nr:unnamed protein product [Timema bartmani]